MYTSILGIVSPMTGDELYGGRLYALHAFGAQLFKSCDPSFRGATNILDNFLRFLIFIIKLVILVVFMYKLYRTCVGACWSLLELVGACWRPSDKGMICLVPT